ncbi:MFS transporter [Streptomyces sulfonofaciens]|uniref:MFS transporter n=1 Tax=Streptomyces sulfonofaciens TaxID=68272 RepID=A0A919GFC6_9ACTN|nr:MFS transporter [Streptomyces sulfonofaciens]GHH82906.1 MFS transporter [Streptomyces sulfonofaciens]
MEATTFDQALSQTSVPRRVYAIAAIAGVAVVFDGFDLQALSYTLPKLVAEWHISSVEAGLLASYTFIGLFAGAVGLGAMGDRLGRKRILVSGIVIFALFMGSAGFAQSYEQFVVLRFCAALGMGGVLPGAITMLGEYTPSKFRGRIVALGGGCFTLGFSAAAVLAMVIVPDHGWRPMFHVSYFALIAAALVAWIIPETPQYLASRGRYDEAFATVRRVFPALGAAPATVAPGAYFAVEDEAAGHKAFRTLWTPRYLQSTVLLTLLYLFLQFVVYALDFWMVSLLVKHGMSLVGSYSYAIEQALAATAGGFAIGWVLDRVDKRVALAIAFAAGGVCLFLFGLTDSVWALYVLNALAGALIIGGQNVVHSLVMGTYATEVRATGLGWALGVGRLGGVLGPLVGGFLLDLDLPYPVYFIVFAVPALLTSVTTLALWATQVRQVREGHVLLPVES